MVSQWNPVYTQVGETFTVHKAWLAISVSYHGDSHAYFLCGIIEPFIGYEVNVCGSKEPTSTSVIAIN